jgi:hypothetical protein
MPLYQFCKRNNSKNSVMKKRVKILLIIIIIWARASEASAQVPMQTIRGTVVDKSTQAPLPGAAVIILNTSPLIGVTTDLNGKFRMEKVQVGRCDIKASYMGYEPGIIRELLVGSGKEVVINFELQESARQLNAVEIKATDNKQRAINPMATVSARQLNVEESSRYAGGFDDPARLASAFAGVVSSMASNGIVVRGNAPKGLLWKLEGVEIATPSHFSNVTTMGGGGITALSSQMLANSDFYTGAFPAEYGNALSGVFDVKLRNGNSDKREHTFKLSTIGIDLASEGPFVKGKSASYLFNYRYSTFSLIAPLLPEDAGGISYQDFSFKTFFSLKKAGTLSFWGLASTDVSGAKAEKDSLLWKYDQDREDQKNSSRVGAAGVAHKIILSRKSFLSSTLSASGYGMIWKIDRFNSEAIMQPLKDIDFVNWKYSFSSYLSHKFNARHVLKAGINVDRLNYNIGISHAESPGTPMQTIVDEKGHSYLVQSFLQSKINFSDVLSFNAGFHSQYFALNSHGTIEPRAGLRWEFKPGKIISLGYGNHSQLEMLNFYLSQQKTEDGIIQPNKNLDFSRANHFVAAYDQATGKHFRFKAEAYYQHLYKVPVIPHSSFSMLNLENEWFLNDSLINTGTGRNFGIDLTFERFLSDGYYFLVTGSVFDSKYTGGDAKWRNTRYNGHYVTNFLAGNEWNITRRSGNKNILSVNGRITMMGGNRISPVNEQATYLEEDVVYDETRAFADKKPNVFYADLTISYTINHRKYAGTWSAQLMNLTGTKEFYGYRYNQLQHTIDRQEEVTMIPNISYKIDF